MYFPTSNISFHTMNANRSLDFLHVLLVILFYLQPVPPSLVVNIKINIETFVVHVAQSNVFGFIVLAPGILYNIIKRYKAYNNSKIILDVINLVEGELKIINR